MHFFNPQSRSLASGEQNDDRNNRLRALQGHCCALLNRLSSSLHSHAQKALRLAAPPSLAAAPPTQTWRFDLAMKVKDVEERLAGIPLYALSNAQEEFMLVTGVKSGKSIGLLCFRKEDAEVLLDKVRSLNPSAYDGSRVVPVALNKVFQLKVDGVALRFVPDSKQIVNAIQLMEGTDGYVKNGFQGVPLFQSQSLFVRSQNKRYRPFFFRKEDLEDSLHKTSRHQSCLNPALRGDIQVATLEEIINAMRVGSDLRNLQNGSSISKWDDAVFIPPGYDVSEFLDKQPKVTANA